MNTFNVWHFRDVGGQPMTYIYIYHRHLPLSNRGLWKSIQSRRVDLEMLDYM